VPTIPLKLSSLLGPWQFTISVVRVALLPESFWTTVQRRLNTASVVQLRNVPASKEKIHAMRTVLLAFTLIVAMGVTGVVATEAGVYVGETWLTCTRC